jgi:phage baseplate assembly protein W
MANFDLLGQDLALGFVADESGTTVAGPFSSPDLQAVQHGRTFPRAVDLNVVSGLANFVQSLIARLETERGELAPLGHPTYGSRHHQLIGEPNTESNRNLVKLYILECLKQEPRIAAVVNIDVQQGPGRENRDKVDVNITLRALGAPDPLNFVVPFSFAGPLS